MVWVLLYVFLWGLFGFKIGVNKYFFKGYVLFLSNYFLFMLLFLNKLYSVEFVYIKVLCDELGYLVIKLVNFKFVL